MATISFCLFHARSRLHARLIPKAISKNAPRTYGRTHFPKMIQIQSTEKHLLRQPYA